MTKFGNQISDTELDVLKVLWELESATVRALQDRANAQGKSWAYTTVQTLLHRLLEKGFVTSEKQGRAHVFVPSVTREELLNRQLGELANRVCEGASTPLMLCLFEGRRFTSEEIAEFRQRLDELEQVSKKPRSPAAKKKRSTRKRRRD